MSKNIKLIAKNITSIVSLVFLFAITSAWSQSPEYTAQKAEKIERAPSLPKSSIESSPLPLSMRMTISSPLCPYGYKRPCICSSSQKKRFILLMRSARKTP